MMFRKWSTLSADRYEAIAYGNMNGKKINLVFPTLLERGTERYQFNESSLLAMRGQQRRLISSREAQQKPSTSSVGLPVT